MTPKQLKASILQLAIQGKLVPQDPNDEPASELLKRIENAKNAKGAKKGKPLPPITDDEKPFRIPDSWVWVRLGEVVSNNGQKIPDRNFSYIDIGSIDNERLCLSLDEHIVSPNDASPRARKIVKRGDIIYSSVRPYLHNTCIIDREFSEEPIASTGFAVMSCSRAILNKFLLHFLVSPSFDQYANASENAKGVAYPAISDKRLYSAPLPLPPLAEQKRIVAKIGALFKYVDECEDGRKQLAEKLAETLKRSVLQEAIQGRLVPQDPNDEPASELLKRIAAEREKQFAKKKIKKQKPLPPIKDEEKPFPIPDSWEWVRLGAIVHYSMGKTPPRSDVKYWMDGAYNWVSISDMMADGHIVATNERVSVIAAKAIFGGRISEPGTLLMSLKLTVGKVSILDIPAFHNEAMISIYPFADNGNTTRDYLFKVLPVLSQNGETKSAIKGNTLNSSSLNNLLIPLPPLAEQKRIVAKVDSLLAKLEEVREAVCAQLF